MKRHRFVWASRRRTWSISSASIAWVVCAATVMLVWLGYQATSNSQQHGRMLLERSATEKLALLSAGISQDMKGAYATVLVPITPGQLIFEPPYDLAEAFARGFARFPYPETFFAWKDATPGENATYVFTRSDPERRPSWRKQTALAGPYPVEVMRDPAVLRDMVLNARAQANQQRPFGVFETEIHGTPYQIVVNLLYRSDGSGRLFGLVGLMVNLDWARDYYFQDLVRQIARLDGDAGLALAVLDEADTVVVETAAAIDIVAAAKRPFPLLFLDRSLFQTLQPQDLRPRQWTSRVRVAADNPLVATVSGTDPTFILISLAALAAVVAVLATSRSMGLAAELATMKSDFVSGVTHELKTPLAVIQLTAETLAGGRYQSPDTIREYLALLLRETRSFSSLVDNLLAYARLSDGRDAFRFEPTHLNDVVLDALERLDAILREQKFQVDVELPNDLPMVRGDRSGLIQTFESLIDNAIKYSNGTRYVGIKGTATDQRVSITVLDHGIGIARADIAQVCDRFFRGHEVKVGGSGLGLAIAKKIVEAHAGWLTIESEPGHGTNVTITLPSLPA